VFLRAPLGDGRAARLFLGDQYSLGADQVDAIATIRGLTVHSFERMDVKADGYRTKMRRMAMRLAG
jgi:DNA polymerase-3 subunit alpha